MMEREKTEVESEKEAKRKNTIEATVKKCKRYRYKYINTKKEYEEGINTTKNKKRGQGERK